MHNENYTSGAQGGCDPGGAHSAGSEFAPLVEVYYPKILYYSLKKIRDMHEAEDITQRTFLKAFLNFRNLKNKDAFSPWLFRICGNEINEFIKSDILKNGREKLKPDITSHPAPAAGRGSEIQEKLRDALSRLSPEHRDALTYKYFCGFSLRQIKALTGLGEGLIKSRIHEAKLKLASIMHDTAENSDLRELYLKRRQIIMEKINFIETGAFVFSRLSLRTQVELLNLAETNEKFSESALVEIGETGEGREFVKQCDAKLSRDEIVKIISFCDEETIKRLKWRLGEKGISADIDIGRSLKKLRNKGYLVNAVDVMLMTDSVEDTLKWFENTLGWKGHRGMFDDKGTCCYGCVSLDDKEPIISGNRGFYGFHVSLGEKCGGSGGGILPMVTVDGLEELLKTIKKSGWKDHSEIKKEEWGARTLSVKDINGYSITFMEWPPEIKNPYKDEQ